MGQKCGKDPLLAVGQQMWPAQLGVPFLKLDALGKLLPDNARAGICF
jgi:hypothetical protein